MSCAISLRVALMGVVLLGIAAPAHAQSGFERRGANVRAAIGVSAAHLDSDSSISNGFLQRIPSSANAFGPRFEIRAGGTLGDSLQLGGAFRFSNFFTPEVSTLGRRFSMADAHILTWSLGPFASWYPIPNWFVSGNVSIAVGEVRGGATELDGPLVGQPAKGFEWGLEVGREWWISRKLTLGVVGGLQYLPLTATDEGVGALLNGSTSGAPHATLLQTSLSVIAGWP